MSILVKLYWIITLTFVFASCATTETKNVDRASATALAESYKQTVAFENSAFPLDDMAIVCLKAEDIATGSDSFWSRYAALRSDWDREKAEQWLMDLVRREGCGSILIAPSGVAWVSDGLIERALFSRNAVTTAYFDIVAGAPPVRSRIGAYRDGRFRELLVRPKD